MNKNIEAFREWQKIHRARVAFDKIKANRGDPDIVDYFDKSSPKYEHFKTLRKMRQQTNSKIRFIPTKYARKKDLKAYNKVQEFADDKGVYDKAIWEFEGERSKIRVGKLRKKERKLYKQYMGREGKESDNIMAFLRDVKGKETFRKEIKRIVDKPEPSVLPYPTGKKAPRITFKDIVFVENYLQAIRTENDIRLADIMDKYPDLILQFTKLENLKFYYEASFGGGIDEILENLRKIGTPRAKECAKKIIKAYGI